MADPTAAELEHIARTRLLARGDRVRVQGLDGLFLVEENTAENATVTLSSETGGGTLRVGRLALLLDASPGGVSD